MKYAVLDWILDLFFPPKCVFCQKLLVGADKRIGVCAPCDAEIPKLPKSEGVQRKMGAGLCYSPLHYEHQVRKSIHRFKFNGRACYGKAYGKIVADYIKTHCENRIDMVTWVPLSKKSYNERGYDQSFLVAKEVAKQLELPLVPTLVKTRHTKKQSSLEKEERSANVLDAYKVISEETLKGKRCLLVDDVVTTGATLGECTYQLRMAGAIEVLCGAVASAS